jgi:protein SCO1/2
MQGAHNFAELPVLGNKELDSKGDTIFHTVAPFEFTNFDGQKVTNKTFENRIYIANFFFTRCKSICPKLSANMKILQDRFKEYDDVAFLSHTVDPEYDTQEVLAEYADMVHAIPNKWYLVTGDKHEIYKLARESYFAAASSGNEGKPEDFVHSEFFALVDQKGRIRALCDGTAYKKKDKYSNSKGVHDFIDDIKALLAASKFSKKSIK